MKAGRWPGRVKDYGISETGAGDPQVFIQFTVAGPDGEENLTWFGSLKEKALDITLKALLAAGFTGKDVSELLDGPDGGAIPLEIECSLVVEDEVVQKKNESTGFYEDVINPDGSKKTRPKIKWVNKPGGGGVQRADAATAKAKLAKLGLAGKLAQVKTQNPDLVRDAF